MIPFDPASIDLGKMPPEQVGAILEQVVKMMTKAPWETRRAQARFQQAIDAWDVSIAEDAARSLNQYNDIWYAAVSSIPDHDAGVAELLPLDEHGAELLRHVDIGELTAMRQFNIKHHTASVESLLRTCRGDWMQGLPQASSAQWMEPVPNDPHVIKERVDVAVADLLERLRGPRPDDAPAWTRDTLTARIEAAGARLMSHHEFPKHHILYEFLAHRFAYAPEHPTAPEILGLNDFRSDFLGYRTKSGLNFFVLEPTKEQHRRPVIVFRGTQPDDLKDIKTDLEFQIGQEHFSSAQELGLAAVLKALVASHGDKVNVTGHSLGGALAQLAALTWPEYIGEVVTFQAPGLTRLNALRGARAIEQHGFDVVHYIADADLVHKAGQRHLPGRTVLVTGVHVDRKKVGMGHSDFLLADATWLPELQGMKLTEHWEAHTMAAWGELAEHPTTVGSLHEAVRASVALGLETTELLLSARPREAMSERGPELMQHAFGVEESIGRGEAIRRVAARLLKELPRVMTAGTRELVELARRRDT